MKLSFDDFKRAGEIISKGTSFTDEEISLVIEVLYCLIKFFKSQEESSLKFSLMTKLNEFECYKSARERMKDGT